MLLYLDETIKPTLESMDAGEKARYDAFFHDLGYASSKRWLYLCGERQTLKYLHRQPNYGNYYLSLAHKAQSHKGVMNEVNQIFALTFSQTKQFTPKELRNVQSKCKLIPIGRCVQEGWRFNTECRLLVENLTDAYFYRLIGERYLLERKLNLGAGLSFYSQGGGGGTTSQNFLDIVKEHRIPTLCVADSDWRYGPLPGRTPPNGGTLNDLREAIKQCSALLPLFELYPLPAHEAENLIPIEILEALAAEKRPNMWAGIQVLQRLSELSDNPSPILYYDYKSGVDCQSDGAKRDYWQSVAGRLGKDLSQDCFPAVCREGLLKDAVEQMEAHGVKTQRFRTLHIDSCLKPLWKEIGLTVLTWGIASVPGRV